jgi:hypothetical protein
MAAQYYELLRAATWILLNLVLIGTYFARFHPHLTQSRPALGTARRKEQPMDML